MAYVLRVLPSKITMKVLLTRKFAEVIDDVDLKGHGVGDVLDLSEKEAQLLVAESWAMPDRRHQEVRDHERRRRDDELSHDDRFNSMGSYARTSDTPDRHR